MSEVLHTASHIFGFCGEGHIKLFDLLPFISYLNESYIAYRAYASKLILAPFSK